MRSHHGVAFHYRGNRTTTNQQTKEQGQIMETTKKKDGVMLATCGHEDSLGYLTSTPCGKCVRKNHKKAIGKK